MTLASFLARLERVRKVGAEFMACCPAHDDQSPSLSVTEKDGAILLYCFAGCSTEDVVRAMGLTMRDLFDDDGDRKAPTKRSPPAKGASAMRGHDASLSRKADEAMAPTKQGPPTKQGTARRTDWGEAIETYVYEDADGKPLHYVVRRHVPNPEGGYMKQFPQGRYVDGRKVKGLDGVKTVLYRLPQLLAASPEQVVYLPEGEKDVHAFEAQGLLATWVPGGGDKFREDHAEVLRGRPVVIVMDPDAKGQKNARTFYQRLIGVAASVRVVRARTGKDAHDHFAAGHTVEEFEEIKMSFLDGELENEERSVKSLELQVRSFADIEAVEVDWLWHPYLPRGEVTILAGDGGIGKSLMALAIAAALSLGLMPISNAPCEPVNTLYVTAEDDPARALKPRLMKLSHDESRIHVLDCGIGATTDNWLDVVRAACIEHNIGLIVIDPLQAFSGERDLNKTFEARRTMRAFHALAREVGCSIIIIAHFNKGTGGKAQYRVNGSTDIVNAARSAIIVGVVDKDGQEIKVMAHVKSNYAQRGATLSFTTDDGTFAWGGAVAITAEDISTGTAGSTKRDEAASFLTEALAQGPVKQADIEARAKDAGISPATLRRAKSLLGVRSARDYGAWWWSLPDGQDAQGAQDGLGADVEHVEPLAPPLNLNGQVQDAQAAGVAAVGRQPELFGGHGGSEAIG